MMKRIIGTMTAIASAIIMLATVQVTAMAAPQAKDAQPPAQGAATAQGEAPKGGQAPKDGEQPPEMPDASGAASTGEAPEKPEGEAPKAIEDGEELSEVIAPKDAEPAVNEDGSADESVEKTSPIKKIGNAIKSFFNKLFKKSE